jgi:hypothetical protein
MQISPDQFDAMQKEMEDEHRRDREAFDRMRRFVKPATPVTAASVTPKPAVPSPASTAAVPIRSTSELEDEDSLIGSVLDVIRARPSTSMHRNTVYREMKAKGFVFAHGEVQGLASVGVALSKLAARQVIRRVRKGAGRMPSLYRAVVERSEPEGAATQTEMALQ